VKKKVRAKALISKRKKRKCYFCGKPATSRHHIIPKRIGGSGLRNNQVDMCEDCHKKMHKLLDPVIDYLLIYIKGLQKTQAPPQMRKIGFLRTNGRRKK